MKLQSLLWTGIFLFFALTVWYQEFSAEAVKCFERGGNKLSIVEGCVKITKDRK